MQIEAVCVCLNIANMGPVNAPPIAVQVSVQPLLFPC